MAGNHPVKDDPMTPYGTAPPAPARGSLGLALACGLGAAIGGAVVWGLIAYISRHQFSIVAVLLGLAVGSAVARFRHNDPLAAVASAVLAVLGCALGSFLALVFALAGAGREHGFHSRAPEPHHCGLPALTGRPHDRLLADRGLCRIPDPGQQDRVRRGGQRRGRFPASGAPAQHWSPSQPGQPSFGQPPEGQPSFGQPQPGQPSFGLALGQPVPVPGAGDQPDSGYGG